MSFVNNVVYVRTVSWCSFRLVIYIYIWYDYYYLVGDDGGSR